MEKELENTLNKIRKEGVISKKETEDFHEWFIDEETNSTTKEEFLKEIWDQQKSYTDESTQPALKKVLQKVGHSNAIPKKQSTPWLRQLVAAAVIAFISISATYYITAPSQDSFEIKEFYNSTKQVSRLTLPDGSIATLNSGTTVIYPIHFNGNSRSVHLIGEAHFKVAQDKNKPFVVKAKGVEVTALGTTFNIEAYPQQTNIETTLFEGSVSVLCTSTQEKIVLQPGEQVTLSDSKNKFEKATVDLSDVLAWQEGNLVFRGAAMDQILLKLSLHYGVTIEYNKSDFNNDKYNLNFRKETTLDEAMRIIERVAPGIRYHFANGSCYIIKIN